MKKLNFDESYYQESSSDSEPTHLKIENPIVSMPNLPSKGDFVSNSINDYVKQN